MLSAVLGGAPFAPPLVPDVQLAAMSDDAFSGYLDKWTSSAFAVSGREQWDR
jgi:hypothetical protein